MGDPMMLIRASGIRLTDTTGVDIFLPGIIESRNRRVHDSYVLCDARRLPFRPRSFDVVVCFEVVEHTSKNEGKAMIEAMNRTSRRMLIVSVPSIYFPLVKIPERSNQFLEHKSYWNVEEFSGFLVRGLDGLFVLVKLSHMVLSRSKAAKMLVRLFMFVSKPVAYLIPRIAYRKVCILRVS
jgi:2-polyprenyl-3-methyl-5-hydroxy-6-metoxy-1,4-benzoquinol methylase